MTSGVALSPTSLAELRQAIADSRPGPLRIVGAATKASSPANGDVPRLEMRRVSGITSYNPAECVLTAMAGTPIADIERVLAAERQYLPFDPTHVRAGATLGGTVASGLNGSGRYLYGGVRDFIIGARVVDGEGRAITSGGQVVKNAAGFLTHHALVGSAGRLGAIAEVTVKVFPCPESRATLVARGLSLADAVVAHERVRTTLTDLEALDLEVAPDLTRAAVWVRLGGAAQAQPARLARVRGALQRPVDLLQQDDDRQVWSDAAEVTWAAGATSLVKIPVTPSRLTTVVEAMAPLGTCRVQCGGSVLLLGARGVDAVDATLQARGWRGAVVCGDEHGRMLGTPRPDTFGARVRQALDQADRFR